MFDKPTFRNSFDFNFLPPISKAYPENVPFLFFIDSADNLFLFFIDTEDFSLLSLHLFGRIVHTYSFQHPFEKISFPYPSKSLFGRIVLSSSLIEVQADSEKGQTKGYSEEEHTALISGSHISGSTVYLGTNLWNLFYRIKDFILFH